jgi:hypothetical protein
VKTISHTVRYGIIPDVVLLAEGGDVGGEMRGQVISQEHLHVFTRESLLDVREENLI